jgi:hypothetical protein
MLNFEIAVGINRSLARQAVEVGRSRVPGADSATKNGKPIAFMIGVRMPFTFQVVNLAEVTNRVGSMIGHIGYFAGVEMPRETSQWQTQDMHRKKPATRVTRWKQHQKSARTIIRPHSLWEMTRRFRRPTSVMGPPTLHQYRERLAKSLRRKRKNAPIRTSTRPILREELFDLWVARLTKAFHETITWSTK